MALHGWSTVIVKLRLLLAVHLIIGIAPAATHLIPPSILLLPAVWALAALSVAQLMLLSFWVGMAPTKGTKRLLGALCGTAYVSIWPVVAQCFLPEGNGQERSLITSYLVMLSSYGALIVLFAGAFILIRRRGTNLQRLSASDLQVTLPRVQYSIHQLLVIMSISCVVLALVKNARSGATSSAGFDEWQFVAAVGLMLIVFLVNVVCAAWAALSLGETHLRIALVSVVAVLLGIAFSVAAGHHREAWWLFVFGSLIPLLSTAIVILSLLVVRSCGYRLVPKDSTSPRGSCP